MEKARVRIPLTIPSSRKKFLWLSDMEDEPLKYLYLNFENVTLFVCLPACAFWMLFGENKVPEEFQGAPGSSNYTVSVDGMDTADALFFTLFRMTLVDDYDYDVWSRPLLMFSNIYKLIPPQTDIYMYSRREHDK